VDDVRAIVDMDPVLTASVLRVVNSAALGLREPITSMGRALGYLGDKMVVGIALGSNANRVYGDPLDGYEAASGDLWRHSMLVAIAARETARLTRQCVPPDLAYTAGLLHDIGKPIVSAFVKEVAPDRLDAIREQHSTNYLESERDATGSDHAEVGALLATRWNLPEPLCEVVRHHHAPSEAKEEYRGLCFAVHLADIIAMMSGSGTGCDAMHYPIDAGYGAYLDISNSVLEKLMFMVALEFDKAISATAGMAEGIGG
jgi:putative nucleotidyltransferase with HDIG domain